MKYYVLAVDYQKAFCRPGFYKYKDRPCHNFIDKIFVPYLLKKHLKIAEIISDYRLPRPNETVPHAIPGTEDYQSCIPDTVKWPNIWIKSMNTPDWIRENAGNPAIPPEIPHPEPEKFTRWLTALFGEPREDLAIVLIGLSLDCCVISTAQALFFRGYKVKILKEGSDAYDASAIKDMLKAGVDYQDALFSTVLGKFCSPITWNELQDSIISL